LSPRTFQIDKNIVLGIKKRSAQIIRKVTRP